MDELACLDLTAQAERVRRREVSPGELVEAAIARIERLDPSLNALVVRLDEEARAAAAGALPEAPFAGVPFLVKDLVAEVAGTALGGGSAFLAGAPASARDSELVARYRRAGLIVLGKTNASEFGLLPTTEPAHGGATRNPWDPERGPGGSSGGSATAVASGMVAAAHANDGGGSIRIPASCCALVGLKPTRGRNSLAPRYGDIAGGILCEHVVTRSVRDTARLLDCTAGPLPGDPYAPPPPRRPYAVEAERDPAPLRIALDTVALTGEPADPECARAAEAAARLCEGLGHRVVEASPRVDGPRLFRSFGALMTGYLGWAVGEAARVSGRTPAEEHFEPLTWRMYGNACRQRAGDYLLAVQDLQQVTRQFAALFTEHDLWLTPTLARPPVPLGYFDYRPERREVLLARLGHYTGFTLIANATGQPAISLPLGWSTDGLPIGVQLTARHGAEDVLIALAGQLERASPWADRRPPLWAGPDRQGAAPG